MLQFFRKYQKFFFLFVTIVIVTTFLFFGTYQAIAPVFRGKGDEESYVTQMARFLETEQWMASRKIFAANFLNDGVISKEFLETGMGDQVARTFSARFQEDFAELHAKEKDYIPYVHPFLPSLSATMVWSILAPDTPMKLKALQEGNGGYADRTALLLAQKSFPPAYFAQFIRYQEQSNPGIHPDPRIARDDLPLFGYQTLTDWYGKKYIETVAELIIQTAAKARKLGYKTSKGEILSELAARGQEAFQALKGKIPLPVEGGYGFMQLYLRQIGLKEETALRIWEDVTLFRRLMHEVGDAVLVDPLPMSRFYAFAFENATIELVQMHPEHRLKSAADLELLEGYLAAVGEKANPLDIPVEYASLETIEAKAPELIGKRFSLYYAQTSKKTLQAKVSVKETVEWECDPNHWGALLKQFPELAQKTGNPFDILEAMDAKGRRLVDAYVRKQIVEAHPEWIEEALLADEMEERELFLSCDPSQKTFEGIKDAKKLASALNEKNELVGYTQDKNHYYRFLVKEKSENKEILTFKEALKAEILAPLAERMEAKKLAKAVAEACPDAFKEIPFAYRFAPFISTRYYNPPVGALEKQFAPEKKEKTVTRCEKGFIALDEVLAMGQGEVSHVKVDASEGAHLYRFIDKKQDKTLPVEKLIQAQEVLSKEARCKYFETLLSDA